MAKHSPVRERALLEAVTVVVWLAQVAVGVAREVAARQHRSTHRNRSSEHPARRTSTGAASLHKC